jgi:hypothetical protein
MSDVIRPWRIAADTLLSAWNFPYQRLSSLVAMAYSLVALIPYPKIPFTYS